jgi:hypothetical protein
MPEDCIYIARSSAIAARALAGEMMVMNSADSTFFTLNEVATAIFQAADGHTPLREIVRNQICEQFDVDPEQAQADAEQFVAELSAHGILLVSNQPLAAETARRHSTWACLSPCTWTSPIAATSAVCIAISITTTTAR